MSVSCSTTVIPGSTVTQTSVSSVPTVLTSTGAARTSTSTVLSVGSSCSAGATVSGGGAASSVCATSTATSFITTTIAGSNAAYTSFIPTTITSVSTAAAQTTSVCVTADPTTTAAPSSSSTTTTTTTPPVTSTTSSSSSTTTTSSSSSTAVSSDAVASTSATPSSATSASASSSSPSSSGFQTLTSYSTLLVTTTGADGAASIATTSSAIAGLQPGAKQGGTGASHASTGAIAGGVVGGVAGLALLAGVVLLLRRKGFFRKDADEHFTDDMWAPQAHSPGMAGFGAAAAATGVRSRQGHTGEDEDDAADHSHNSAEGMMMSEKNFDRQASWYSSDQHAPLPTSNSGAAYYAQPSSSHGHGQYPSADGIGAMGLAGVGAGGTGMAHHQGVGSMSSGGHGGPDGMYYGQGAPSATGHNDYYGSATGHANPAYPAYARSPPSGHDLSNSYARQGSPGPLALDEPGHHLGLDFSSGAVPGPHSGTHDAYGGLSDEGEGAAVGDMRSTAATAMGSEEGHLSDLAHPELPYARPGNARHNSADSFTGPSQFLGARVANGDDH